MQQLTQQLPYVCNVCHQPYADTWDHVLTPSKLGMLAYKDQAHAYFGKAIEDSIEPAMCFCGGKVVTIGIGAEGWDRSCQECGMLYAED